MCHYLLYMTNTLQDLPPKLHDVPVLSQEEEVRKHSDVTGSVLPVAPSPFSSLTSVLFLSQYNEQDAGANILQISTYIDTPIQSYTHSLSHTHTHTLSLSLALSNTHTHTHSHKHRHIQTDGLPHNTGIKFRKMTGLMYE